MIILLLIICALTLLNLYLTYLHVEAAKRFSENFRLMIADEVHFQMKEEK